ncbi:MAG: RNA-binding S4 domain-containing protein [Alphaproteobacteria bacterium]|nr:RNA-binding S4 domain-containing protein [Alphaproteobacteria bacterium]
MTDDHGPSLRIDKWLWYARFYKTRSLAAKSLDASKMRLDGRSIAKPNAAVRPGNVLTFSLGPHVRVIKVVDLGTRRGPAPEARLLYEDLAPPPPPGTASKDPRPAFGARDPGTGRPTKRDRRQLDRFKADGLNVDTLNGDGEDT